MAAEKTSGLKQKSKRTDSGEGSGTALRLRSDPRKERRYEPKASPMAVLSVVGMSIGAVLLGAGTYAQWLRADPLGPHKAAPWLLLGGALLLTAIALAGPQMAKPIRIGDAGVARERDAAEIERIEWRDITRILLGGDVLAIESPGQTIFISLKLHAQAAARLFAEAKARIPSKLEDIKSSRFEALDDAEGEVLPLERPQLAGSRCKATDKLIAFEKDARLCGKCGEVYHKDAVPPACLTCEAKLVK